VLELYGLTASYNQQRALLKGVCALELGSLLVDTPVFCVPREKRKQHIRASIMREGEATH
jgi:hypothetical protein